MRGQWPKLEAMVFTCSVQWWQEDLSGRSLCQLPEALPGKRLWFLLPYVFSEQGSRHETKVSLKDGQGHRAMAPNPEGLHWSAIALHRRHHMPPENSTSTSRALEAEGQVRTILCLLGTARTTSRS